MLGLAGLGVFLPVLPTVPFVLAASVFFSIGNPRMYRRLHDSYIFGAYIEGWRTGQGVTAARKAAGIIWLWVMLSISVLITRRLWLASLLAVVGTTVTIHLLMLKTKKFVSQVALVKAPAAEAKADISRFSQEYAERVLAFHRSFPTYRETPLGNLSDLAGRLGLGELHVKDESGRFGLNAFKALGGSYAIGCHIADQLGLDLSTLSYEKLASAGAKDKTGGITFVTATDGNHGRGVAWTAKQFNQKAVVYLPKGSRPERLLSIRAEGAEASVTALRYDDAVRLAGRKAGENGWVLVQDTAWEGYEDIPFLIMQGYMTMAAEAAAQLGKRPTHIFLQAGVGSMAAAVAGFFANVYGDAKPLITVVEPCGADCFYQTAKANDGKRHFAEGDLNTIMAGLACGEPSLTAWPILRSYADFFVSCSDDVAIKGMRLLGRPTGDDPKIVSGESGAVTAGLVAELMLNPGRSALREALGLGADSVVLCFSTEGDTDSANYKRIMT